MNPIDTGTILDHLTDREIAVGLMSEGRSYQVLYPLILTYRTITQRSSLADVMRDILRQRRKRKSEARRQKQQLIRRITPAGIRQPCVACGGFRPITQRHHIRPVADSDPADPRSTETVWLCPNCHTIVHYLAGGRPMIADLEFMLTDEQYDAIRRIAAATREAAR